MPTGAPLPELKDASARGLTLMWKVRRSGIRVPRALRLRAQSAKDNGSPVLAYMVEMLASAAGRAARAVP